MKKLDFIIISIIILLGLSGYASTSMTIEYFGNIGDTEQIRRSNFLLALVNDTCKYLLPMVVGVVLVRKNYFLATGVIILIACNMTMSFLASQGLDLNIANKQLNDNVKTSDEYTMNKATFETALETKASLTEKLNTLQSEDIQSKIDNDSTIKLYKENKAAAKRKNWKTSTYDKKGNVVGRVGYLEWQKRINNREQEIRDDHALAIKQAETNISNQDTLMTDSKTGAETATGGATTEGYHSLAKDLGMDIGKLLKIKNIFMELFPVMLSALLGNLLAERHSVFFDRLSQWNRNRKDKKEQKKENGHPSIVSKAKAKVANLFKKNETVKAQNNTHTHQSDLQTSESTFYPDDDNEVVEMKEMAPIGFKADLEKGVKVDNKEVKRYIVHMIKTMNDDGTSRGFNGLGKELGINARPIFEFLKQSGVIDTSTGGSVINMKEAKKWL